MNGKARGKISTTAAAARIGVHRRTIHRWIYSGRLPAYRVGPTIIRLDPADVDAMVRPFTTDPK